MKTYRTYLLQSLFLAGTAMNVSCASAQTVGLDAMSVVSTSSMVNGNSMLTCRLSALTDTLNLPLSQLVEEPEIIPLDTRDEAQVRVNSGVTQTDSHILIWGRDQVPFKLFDRQGKYIASIPQVRTGDPNRASEMKIAMIYDAEIDEGFGRVYLATWPYVSLLSCNLKGEDLQFHPTKDIGTVGKGVIHVDGNQISVMGVCFGNMPYQAWTQSTDGKTIFNRVQAPWLKVPDESTIIGRFSNEIFHYNNVDAVDMSYLTCNNRPDTLYNYDTKKGVLIPRFTLDLEDQRTTMLRRFNELPRYILGTISGVRMEGRNAIGLPEINYIVEKSTGKGAFVHYYDDYLGIEVGNPNISDGYYYLICTASEMKAYLTSRPNQTPLHSAWVKKNASYLKKITSEEDLFLVRAKIKK